MPNSYNKIWIHAVFSTKNRFPLIEKSIENKIYNHMREQLVEYGCPVRIINGMPDHVHLLFLQNPNKSIADIMKQVKGHSSYWINDQEMIRNKFSWQSGFGAFSVSESQVEKVFQYISNQKEHHLKKTFMQEYDDFVSAHGLVRDENG